MSTVLYVVLSIAELLLLGGLVFSILRINRLKARCEALQQEREVIYGFVHDVGEVFADADSVDMDLMMRRVLFYALRTTKAGAGALFQVGAGDETLRARAISGVFPPLAGDVDAGLEKAVSKSQHVERLVRTQRIRKGEGLVGEVADFGVPILIDDAERDPRVPHYDEDFLQIHSILLVPMRFHQRVLGVLAVVNRVDGQPFIQSDLNLLQALADQASVSMHFAELRETLDEKQRIDHDLDVARQIQMSLLPKKIPKVQGFELAAFDYPALEVGGDYYDFVPVDETHIGIAIADVSGKGISGAIMMSICRSLLRSQARGTQDPAEVLCAVNHLMREDIADDMFVSMLYMVLDTETRELVVARAGHERPILAPGDGSGLRVVDSTGIAIGIGDPEAFDGMLKVERVLLNPGDVIVVYTDGVTEAMNERGEEWGIDNFLEAIKIAADEGAHSVLNNVQQRLLRFVGDMAQYDDMTLLALRVMR
jgi:sigma-B regulation protein RsbU (phosphoserine phosphatase)